MASEGQASILSMERLTIDFTNQVDAEEKATWSESANLNITANGLGWDCEAATVRDGWIQTRPLAVGLSWRSASSVTVRVATFPAPVKIDLNSGQKSTPYGGSVYVRYSPDLKHWSTWQALSPGEAWHPHTKDTPGRYFSGMVQVPQRERDKYGKLLSTYSKLDVPWASDEEAAVRWILERDPRFFEKQLPFVGYVEFLFEQGFYGGQRIRSFDALVGFGLSGVAAVPRDIVVQKKHQGPWRFQAEPASKQAEDSVGVHTRHSLVPAASRFPSNVLEIDVAAADPPPK